MAHWTHGRSTPVTLPPATQSPPGRPTGVKALSSLGVSRPLL